MNFIYKENKIHKMGNKRVSKEEFIERSNKIHDFKYDYSLVDYINLNTKVIIICKKHGEFTQRPSAHSKGQGCPKCGIPKPNLLTTDTFIKRSKIKHGDKYDYSLVEYKDSRTNVKIKCKKHGIFNQNPLCHYNGSGCRKCYSENIKTFTKEEIIEEANKKHNFKYDYSLLPDKLTKKEKVTIICENGHHFLQNMKDHIGYRRSNGCKFCSKPCSDTESFIRLANEKHGNKYDYSKSEYKGQKVKTIITCPRHGDFPQTPGNHYHLGRGCPRCGESKGELEIRKFLESNNIYFEKEKTFEDCVNLGRLRFDFWLPEYNTCIEFDGLQHFKPVKQFGGLEEFKLTKQRDLVKNKYCLDVGIRLIRINYKDLKKGIVSDILSKDIKKIK